MNFYNEVLSKMQEKYTQLSGCTPDDASDIGIRLKLLAGELSNLHKQINSVEAQNFPQTSSGKNLDMHAEIRGIARKPQTAAVGAVTFYRDTDAPADLSIPKATVVSTNGTQPKYYRTTEAVTMRSGTKTISSPAIAQETGINSNIATGAICLLVSSASGISGVRNNAPFTGGRESENDEELRTRVINSYHNASNGMNAAYYYDYAIAHPDVAFAKAIPRMKGRGTVGIIICGVDPAIESALTTTINKQLLNINELNVDIYVSAAQRDIVNTTVKIEVDQTADFESISEKCRQVTARYINVIQIGEPLRLNQLGKKLLEIEGMINYKISLPASDIIPLETHVIRCGSITITS